MRPLQSLCIIVFTIILLCFEDLATCSDASFIPATSLGFTVREELSIPVIARAFNAASTSRHSPFSCLHFIETLHFIPGLRDPKDPVPILMALYSTIHASAQGSWASQSPSRTIAVNYGRLQLLMESPLTAIPWQFVADFAWEMLSNVAQADDPGTALYTAYYGSPTSCYGLWEAYYAATEAANLVFVTLRVLPDPGHILPGNPRKAV